MFVGGEIDERLRGVRIFDHRDAIAGRQAGQERVSRLEMAAFEKVHGRAGFDEYERLRGFVNGKKTGDGLLDAIVEDMKIFALQAFCEFAGRIGDEDADVYTIDADANWLLRGVSLGRGWFLSDNVWLRSKIQSEKKKKQPR